MLHSPHLVKTKFIGQSDLLQRVVVNAFLYFAIPGTRHRNFVEQTEFHGRSPPDGEIAQSAAAKKGLRAQYKYPELAMAAVRKRWIYPCRPADQLRSQDFLVDQTQRSAKLFSRDTGPTRAGQKCIILNGSRNRLIRNSQLSS